MTAFPALEVVLYAPEIPHNTGAIARTCAATKTRLHLIQPLSFDISDKAVRRAGLDYWPLVDLLVHADWPSFLNACPRASERLFLFTKFGARVYTEATFQPGDILCFGSETKGLPPEIHASRPPEFRLSIPMEEPRVRSLNLANAASIGIYEAKRQLGHFGNPSAH